MEQQPTQPAPKLSEAMQRHHDIYAKRELEGTLSQEDAAQLALAKQREAEGLVKPYQPPTETPTPETTPPNQG